MSERQDATRSLRRSARSARGEKRKPFIVSLTHEEHLLIKQKAHSYGVSMSRLLIDSVLRSRNVYELPPQQVEDLVTELNALRLQLVGIATNINQIAHHANATQIVTDEIVPVARDAQALMATLGETILDVRP